MSTSRNMASSTLANRRGWKWAIRKRIDQRHELDHWMPGCCRRHRRTVGTTNQTLGARRRLRRRRRLSHRFPSLPTSRRRHRTTRAEERLGVIGRLLRAACSLTARMHVLLSPVHLPLRLARARARARADRSIPAPLLRPHGRSPTHPRRPIHVSTHLPQTAPATSLASRSRMTEI